MTVENKTVKISSSELSYFRRAVLVFAFHISKVENGVQFPKPLKMWVKFDISVAICTGWNLRLSISNLVKRRESHLVDSAFHFRGNVLPDLYTKNAVIGRFISVFRTHMRFLHVSGCTWYEQADPYSSLFSHTFSPGNMPLFRLIHCTFLGHCLEYVLETRNLKLGALIGDDEQIEHLIKKKTKKKKKND